MRVYRRVKKTFYLKLVKKNNLVKRPSFLENIIFVLNSFVALALLIACIGPFVPADDFPFISIFSLGVPILVGINLLFLIYWLLRKKRQALLSLVILVLGYFVLDSFVGFRFFDEEPLPDDLKVMTYNVRSFNKFNSVDTPNIFENTLKFVLEEDPDIICFQEVDYLRRGEFKERYPYQHLRYHFYEKKVLMGIFSKYPIVKAHTLDWANTNNNGAYADILYKNDTIRVYSLHLESLRIHPSAELMEQAKPRLYKNLTRIFKKQSIQAKWFQQHRDSVDYKTIVCGDFNNTQFSNAYRRIKGEMNDSFIERGNGFGTTYNFSGLPYRIDYILADPEFEVQSHKNYKVKYSDHFPVMASFRFKEE